MAANVYKFDNMQMLLLLLLGASVHADNEVQATPGKFNFHRRAYASSLYSISCKYPSSGRKKLSRFVLEFSRPLRP